jgi:chromosome segregation ATPase
MEPAFPPDDQEARVVDLRPRAAAVAARRLADAEAMVGTLQERLEALASERDGARAAAFDARGDALGLREQLAARMAAESEAVAVMAVLRGQLEELRVRTAARDARDEVLARLAGELAAAARAAREDVERHAEARAQAEAALDAERRRTTEVEGALAAERTRAAQSERALRAELDTLRSARERAVGAEVEAQAARRAELEALHAARDRLDHGAGETVTAPDGLMVGLGRAAQRLREDTPAARPSWPRRLAARLRGSRPG